MATQTSGTHVATTRGVKFGQSFLSLTRIALGLTFLWAFFDKLLALGFATGRDGETGVVDYFGDKAWINGGPVTEGFLVYGSNPDGPFHDFFVNLGGQRWTDVLFMLGLLGVGLALTFGIGTKIGAWAGTLMFLFMYLAIMLPENNPILDDHIIYSLALIGIVYVELQHQPIGLGSWWRRLPLVQKNPWLV